MSLVLGVPTVKREAQSYLLSTLASLIDGLSPEDRNRTLIIVFVAETDAAYVASVAEKIKKLSVHVFDLVLLGSSAHLSIPLIVDVYCRRYPFTALVGMGLDIH